MFRTYLLALLLVLIQTGTAKAQDAHYWTYPYGTRAQLLGGVVIGSVVDISATYYNPGALSLLTAPDVVAVSKVVELASTNLETEGSEATRFFHVVLDEETPSFLHVPGSTTVLPLEEVIRGFLYTRFPDLERAESHLFRFRTAEVTVKEVVPNPAFRPEEAGPESVPGPLPVSSEPGGEEMDPVGEPTTQEPSPLDVPPVLISESRQSVVVRIKVHPQMPESHQAQLLRALERQVSRKSPLIGWSDIYPVSGPMDLTGLADLLKLKE